MTPVCVLCAVSPMAATTFSSGRAYSHRPWESARTGDDAIECFHRSKLHPSVEGWDYVLAGELLARVAKDTKMSIKKVTACNRRRRDDDD